MERLHGDDCPILSRGMTLVLASASPRRRELLAAAGVAHHAVPVDVDETPTPGESPADYVERVALLKADAAAVLHPGRFVVGADTAVVLGEDLFGKPRDEADAERMVSMLAGRSHEVLTGLAVVGNGQRLSLVERTTVWMAPLNPREIKAYVRTGEPFGKAGGYAIQGRASRFVLRIAGSYTNVVGLPVAAVVSLLRQIGWTEETRGGPRMKLQ